MNIQDEIREAHKAYLQDEWDKWLINGWRKASTITAFAMTAFTKKHGISNDEFFALKRIPLYTRQSRTTLTRFIAAYLPQLNNMLWSDKATDEQILLAMKGMRTRNNPADQQKAARESAERKKAAKEAQAQKSSYCLVREQRESTAKSNWNHCK